MIYYSGTQAQVFDFATSTWWDQTNYYANGNAIQYATATSILPFDATVNLVCTDYTYDLQDWDLKITMESTYSTHANARGSDDFKLLLKDVCWDIPLDAPILSHAEYNFYLWDVTTSNVNTISEPITIGTAMAFNPSTWTSTYCGGFSYSLVYVSGPAASAKYQELDVDLNMIGLDTTDGNQIETELNALLINTDGTLTIDGFFDSEDWIDPSLGEGVWTVKIKGTTG